MTRLKRRLIGVGLLASVMMIGSGSCRVGRYNQDRSIRTAQRRCRRHGASERQAVDLAINEKNAAGGIRGKQIEAIYADDAGKPEEAVNVAKRLTARDNVVIMIGSISSPASLAASQVAAQSQNGPDRRVRELHKRSLPKATNGYFARRSPTPN